MRDKREGRDIRRVNESQGQDRRHGEGCGERGEGVTQGRETGGAIRGMRDRDKGGVTERQRPGEEGEEVGMRGY